MIPYILHASVITTICFLFYKLLLQKETFYQLNRWMLLGCLAVSFVLPLLPVPRAWSWGDKWKQAGIEEVVLLPAAGVVSAAPAAAVPPSRAGGVLLPASPEPASSGRHSHGVRAAVSDRHSDRQASELTPVMTSVMEQAAADPVTSVTPVGPVSTGGENRSGSNTAGTPVEKNGAGTLARFFSGATLLLTLLFYGYLFGVLFFGGKFLVQLAVLLYQSYSRPVIRDGCFRIVEVSGNRAPCSFGNTIFINPELYDWETYNQILIHEKIHVSGRHTLDILLAEIALVIQWFNPFSWLYRREVENNLEFLTDANVLLDDTVERGAYQLSLLRVSAPHLPFSITNNYNQSLLKRRIVMMNSKRSALHTVWKYFFLIPLLTCLVCALNKPVAALGATTKKGPVALTDTVKRPVRSADSVVATEPEPARVSGASSGSGSSAGSGLSSAHHSASGSGGSGEGSAYAKDYERSSDAVAEPAVVVGYRKDEAMAVTYAIQQPVAKAFKNLSVTYPTAADVYIRPALEVRAPIKLAELSRYNFIEDSVLTDGSWYATSYGDRLGFELKAEDEEHSWDYNMHVDKGEINPFPGQGNVEFKLVREAGTIVFKGQFDGQEGFGHFHFIPDPAYFPALKQLGVEDLEDRRQFGFFAMNIKKDYVTMLAHNGYTHVSARDLLSLAATHVDEAFIQYWHGADLTDGEASEPRMLIRLKALHIDRAYVDELKAAGYEHLSLRELESMKAQHIDRDYIRSLGRGRDNQPIPVRELVSYKALHIDSAYLQSLRKLGYDNLEMREVSSLYSMHVTPEYIQQLQALGYKTLSARELCNLKAMNVTPDMVKSYQDMGYKGLDTRSLGNLKAMNVSPEFIKGFTDLGYTDLTARDLGSLKAMGVTPEFVAGFNKLGFDHIPVHTLTTLKATGVTPEYVSKMKAQGFDSKELSKYIRLKTDFN